MAGSDSSSVAVAMDQDSEVDRRPCIVQVVALPFDLPDGDWACGNFERIGDVLAGGRSDVSAGGVQSGRFIDQHGQGAPGISDAEKANNGSKPQSSAGTSRRWNGKESWVRSV